MSDRKPPGRPWKTWVEEQIQQAERDGEFDRLEGRGKPIPGIEGPYDPLWWVKKLIEREKVSILPPSLEIRARVDRMVAAIWSLGAEAQVRERVAAINAEIARANRTAAAGPPTTLSPLDIESVLARWRERRSRTAKEAPRPWSTT